jgi:hypothetical protein
MPTAVAIVNLKHIKHSERMQVLEIHINIFISIKNKIVIQVHDITLEFGTVPAMWHDLTLEFGEKSLVLRT